MPTIADNISRVRERIEEAATRCGSDPDNIRLIAVSKTKPVPLLEEALAAGGYDLGENRVQEALEKYDDIGTRATWHLIGHLQTNKARHAIRMFDMIHSVDRLHLGEEISKRCEALEKKMPVLVQVKTSDEDTKSGIPPEQTLELVEQLAALPGISVQGLMTIPALSTEPDDARSAFELLRNLRDRVADAAIDGVEMRYLSMGMTHDFEIAIEEGANMIRVGTAIFGARPVF
mgnify:CR=1 FL=1